MTVSYFNNEEKHMSRLNNEALLARLTVSQWTARKFDKVATKQVADANNTIVSAGRYNKSLLPMNVYLDDVHRMTTQIRAEYYNNTLPWGEDGTTLLPSKNFLEFMEIFRGLKKQWEGLVDKFIQAYPQLQQNAQRTLGSLYNPSDYPDVYHVREKFSMDMSIMPVPSDDFRVGIDEDELKQIQADVEQRVQNSADNAMREAWKRLYEPVKHMAERLADPKAIFRDTLVENIAEVCDVMKRLNVNDDADLETLRQEVETKLSNTQPESLRNDPHHRKDTATTAKDIMKKMSIYMGETNGNN